MKPHTLESITALQEAEESASFSTEQKFFGWIFSSDNPAREWVVFRSADQRKMTVFAREAFKIIEEVESRHGLNAMNLMGAMTARDKGKFFTRWIHQCQKAYGVYATQPPTEKEKKEIGI